MEANEPTIKKAWLFAEAKARIPERDFGITGSVEPPAYDAMLRFCRDGGWMPTKRILRDITGGLALEVGPGPGYLGLEWLKHTSGTQLIGYDISEDMLDIAGRNAVEYGLTQRVEYKRGDVVRMPFADGSFDAVFSNDSLHEWARPVEGFKEIYRVLKPGGTLCISDLRRDMGLPLKGLIWAVCRPSSMRPGWLTSIDASYTLLEMQTILAEAGLSGWRVEQNLMRFFVTGCKPEVKGGQEPS